MNRRSFLRSLGAFAAAAYLPAAPASIIRAPAWAKEVEVFQSAEPLAAGNAERNGSRNESDCRDQLGDLESKHG